MSETADPDRHDVPDELPILPFASQELFASWLEENVASERGVWIKVAKKATGIPTVTHHEALDVALCHGWIDGQRRALDEQFFLQRFTPRTRASRWSKVNCAKVLALIDAGAMRPGGLAEIERARANGSWDAAYDSPANATVPDDLQAALDAAPGAADFFAALDSRNRFSILHRVHDAKRPETRARRIARYAAMCAAGKQIHP
ncbi:YdeI family protein [Conexibacter sp. CPCC 206217]|uniref:YdeI/OmpD-associated family protein n=1 Tax=Conexibacter sp. CPCC 206217 TaxID=3064574 RepID=UPI0027224AE5|nr:YdeI/OmpD-associated family protein [Conexibacter sp. CPCC 206217]MDO8209057.1 YdeI/OmpD-associated family protein [Conexibacter sp. CPCC 206217]